MGMLTAQVHIQEPEWQRARRSRCAVIFFYFTGTESDVAAGVRYIPGKPLLTHLRVQQQQKYINPRCINLKPPPFFVTYSCHSTAMSLSANSLLPSYAPSAVVPPYSPEPGNDERLLEQAPRIKPRVFSGNHTRKFGRDTVVLNAQDEHANVPTYGRSALIDGSVSLEDRESVSKVALEVCVTHA